MDRMLYVAMGGAKQALEQQASVANNMANVSTTGFRAQLNSFLAVPVVGGEMGTRTHVLATTPRADFSQGPLSATGRVLDVAIKGEGWFVVQTANGEAYTRVGNLQQGPGGELLTMDSRPVVGEGGPLALPANAQVSIAPDGLITARRAEDGPGGGIEVGRLKLVNPPQADLVRGDDGLFRMREGLPPADADPQVNVSSGSLEGSNVNPVEAMVAMIANARRFELQMKSIQSADQNAQSANKLLASG